MNNAEFAVVLAVSSTVFFTTLLILTSLFGMLSHSEQVRPLSFRKLSRVVVEFRRTGSEVRER